MKKIKVVNVLVFIGVVANFTLTFDRKPSIEQIMTACDERMKSWLIDQEQTLTFQFRLEGNKIFANNIELDIKITEGSLYSLVDSNCDVSKLHNELLSVAQDLNVDIVLSTGKEEKERQTDMETAIARIVDIVEILKSENLDTKGIKPLNNF